MRDRAKGPVFRVTNAPKSLKADVRSREVRYLISMGIRTVCFVLAFLASGPLRWTFVVAAVILPYIAVVIANAGREQVKRRVPTLDVQPNRPQLPAGGSNGGQPAGGGAAPGVESDKNGHTDTAGRTASTTSASP